MKDLAEMARNGYGCAKDLRLAVACGAKAESQNVFWGVLHGARLTLQSGRMTNLGYNFNELCYSLGCGLYWYLFESVRWRVCSEKENWFGANCLDYYCSCVEMQQKSIFTFLWLWNRATGGVKGPGQMIAQMVWEGREDNLVKKFEARGSE
jgi:hypothetical protein